MVGQLSGWNDTIVALATPPGIGAIGVIRVGGNEAIQIVNTLFTSKDLLNQASHTLHVGFLKEDKKVLDQVVVSIYKSPASYTGEDVVEISTHGSPYIQQKIISVIISKGARLAKPGEFTQRAFLNGKLDLVQAEAVADLIISDTEASSLTAINNIRGGFSDVLKHLRDQMLTFSALIELELDFSQEDVEFADREQLKQLINTAQKITGELIDSFVLGNVIKNGVHVAIIGKPNAGKSTLLNAFLNEERAIVSEIAGTTRDTIEEEVNIQGIIFRLIDTAGLRKHTSDLIESIGIEKSLEKMMHSDIVLYLFDVNEVDAGELDTIFRDLKSKVRKFLIIGNKTDLADDDKTVNKFPGVDVIFISALSNSSVYFLKDKLVQTVISGSVNVENTVVTNARHHAALKKVLGSLNDINHGLLHRIPGDLLALDIRTCLHYLGEITGEITNDDQLDYIFSKFCIGK